MDGTDACARPPRATWLVTAGCVLVLVCAADAARALTFDLSFARSTYQVQGGDTWADLLARHQGESQLSSDAVTALENVSSTLYASVSTDYSMLITTVLDVDVGGTWELQAGTDWGRGGAAIVVENGTGAVLDEYVTTEDLWWNEAWSNPDVFTSTVVLDAGSSYTVGWVGYEGCCGGPTTIRFSVDGAPFQTMSDTNLAPYVVPEPGTGLLVGVGTGVVAVARRRRR